MPKRIFVLVAIGTGSALAAAFLVMWHISSVPLAVGGSVAVFWLAVAIIFLAPKSGWQRPPVDGWPILRLILIYLGCAAFVVARGISRGWALGDTVGMVVATIFIVGWIAVYRRRRSRGKQGVEGEDRGRRS
jgi:hypothetical protein